MVFRYVIVGIICFMSPGFAHASEWSLIYLSGQTVFYAQQEITLQWQLSDPSDPPQVQHLQARLIYANKTILSQNLSPVFPLKFSFTYPELRPGIVADPVLMLTATRKDGSITEVARHQFYFYSAPDAIDAQAFPQEIGIFDLTQEQSLTAFMAQWQLPYTPLPDFRDYDGSWIVCAGLEFDQNPSLFEELRAKFDQGLSILVLPPVTGAFPLPAYQSNSRILFAGSKHIKDYNKTWNLKTAQQGQAGATIGFLPLPGEDLVQVGPVSADNGYTWFEFSKDNQVMLILGWDLMALSETNPTAPILFQYLLTQHIKNRGGK